MNENKRAFEYFIRNQINFAPGSTVPGTLQLGQTEPIGYTNGQVSLAYDAFLLGIKLGQQAKLSNEHDERMHWDDYLMGMAFWISKRSLDPHTKHGCVIVAEDNSLITSGYNSAHAGFNDEEVPLTRPEKYAYMNHSETAAIQLAAKKGNATEGGKLYVTGHPCEHCISAIVNAGIKEVVYGPIEAKCLNWKIIQHKKKNCSVKFTSYNNLELLKKYNFI